MPEKSLPLIMISGFPNGGKSALFNGLTGGFQKIANYAGATVECREGTARSKNQLFRIMDLPGTYSLNGNSVEQKITQRALLGTLSGVSEPTAVIVVVDATQLERTLGFVLELKEQDVPIVVALNMMDLIKKQKWQLDVEKLEALLQIPVVPIVAIKKQGVTQLLRAVHAVLEEKKKEEEIEEGEEEACFKKSKGSTHGNQRAKESAKEQVHKVSFKKTHALLSRFKQVEEICQQVLRKTHLSSSFTQWLDQIVLHPIWGVLCLFSVLTLMFQAVFSWAVPFQDGLTAIIETFGNWTQSIIPNGWFQSFLIEGVLAGVGAVVVFVPQIAILFLFILFLEDSGYLARAAFLTDHWMRKIGLQGKAIIPLLSAHACAIPGMLAARTLSDPWERRITILIAPLMACSARLPVYTLLISAFIPRQHVWGMFSLQGLVLLGLYLLGIVSGLFVAWIFQKWIPKTGKNIFLLDMPIYRMPYWRNVLLGTWIRVRAFLKRAGTIIFAVSIILWVLVSFPKPPVGVHLAPMEYSFAGRIGKTIAPLLKPLGFDWKIATALVPGFAAREVMVGALGTIYAIENKGTVSLRNTIAHSWSLALGLALLIWFVFTPQCISTFAVMKKELGSWKWTLMSFFFMLVLAYVSALFTYQFAVFLGAG